MKIPILHLEDGIHQYDFLIKGGSLHFYREEVYPHDLKIHVELNKFEKNIQCHVEVDTMGHYVCDRCLDEYEAAFHSNFDVLFHIGMKDLETDEEEVILLPPETVDIDLTDQLVENLILGVPMKMLCDENCKGICPGCGADLNHEPCTCKEEPIDPRWLKLKELLK